MPELVRQLRYNEHKNITISLIAAMTQQRIIGNDLQIPWYLPEDFAHFKQTTMHKVIIMGRKTFTSLKYRPLPGRFNIIISTSLANGENYQVVSSISAALTAAKTAILTNKYLPEIMIIGGAQIYQDFLPLADKMYLSIVHQAYSGNIIFPYFDPNEWQLCSEEIKPDFTIQTLQRKYAKP